jgi:hypothetical protein
LSRVLTYNLLDSAAVHAFSGALENLQAWQEWRRAALAETAIVAAVEVG